MLLDEIRNLIIKHKLKEALDLIEKNVGAPEVDDEELALLKSVCLSGVNQYQEAYDSISPFVISTLNIRLAHKAGELCLILKQYIESKKHLTKALELSKKFESTYYLSTCYIERAYVNILLKCKTEAELDIERIPKEESIFWLEGVPDLSKAFLSQEAFKLS